MAKRSQMTGARQLNQTLKDIVPGLNTPIQQAQRKAMRPMLRAAKAKLKANGSYLTGELYRLLSIIRDRTASKANPTMIVGPDKSKGPGYRKAHLVEFGTSPHPIGEGMHPGQAAAPFMRPAFEETKDEMIDVFGKEIGPAVERRAAQLARRNR